MTLEKSSWIVRIAYPFWHPFQIPDAIDRCTLWQRFCAWLLPIIALNIAFWIVFGLILGVIAQPLVRLALLVFNGTKLVLRPNEHPHTKYQTPVVFGRRLGRLTVLNYKRENIWWLDWTELGRNDEQIRCPILVLMMIGCFVGAFWLMVSNIPAALRMMGSNLYVAGTFVYDTSGMWGSGILLFMFVLIAGVALARAYQAFAATPSGTVIVAHVRAWKEQYCTIVKLV